MEEKSENRQIIITLLIATVLFLAVVGTGVGIVTYAPKWVQWQTEKRLAEQNFEGARRWAGRLRDEATADDYLRECDYAEALSLAGQGEWERASALFGSVGAYKDAQQRKQLADYQLADALAKAGRWPEAIEAFTSLNGYGDAAARIDDCRYYYAEQLAVSGDSYAAFELYAALGEYRDADARMAAVAMEATGLNDREEALNRFRNLSPEEAARRAELKAQRDALPKDILDVGFYHTAALRSDGTALACGDNAYGQCEIGGWTDITAIAAGAYHTVGLRSDGRVVCAGRDTEAQCDTWEWGNIIAIAASDYATFGLKADGSVVYTGYQPDYYREVPGWTNVTSITGGSYALGALRADGEALISHEAARSDELKQLCGLTLNTGYAVGLNEDGTVTSPRFDLSDWQEVIALSSSGTGVVGLKTDGSVLWHYFRPLDAPDLSEVHDAVAIACGGTHFAWVSADGSVHVTGETAHGEGDAGNWTVF